MVSSIERFVDPGSALGTYAEVVFCECPKCSKSAMVRGKARYVVPYLIEEARIQCLHCSFTQDWSRGKWHGPVVGHQKKRCISCGYKWLEVTVQKDELSPRVKRTYTVECPWCNHPNELRLRWVRDMPMGKPIDPYFGFPLWLKVDCCDEILWAYNREHLNVLKSYVAAVQRQRNFRNKWSMVTRLPQWIKSAKNRDKLLKCLDRLEAKLNQIEVG